MLELAAKEYVQILGTVAAKRQNLQNQVFTAIMRKNFYL